MAVKTISQRISLEGSDDIKKKLLELGQAGEKAFKQIQDAAKQPITDPAAVQRTQQAFNQLSATLAQLAPQFRQLSGAADQAGASMTQAGQAAERAGEAAGTGLRSAALKFGIAAGVIVTAVRTVVSSLSKGAGETAQEISAQADKLGLTVQQWLKLRQAIEQTSGSTDDFVNSAGRLATALSRLSLEVSGRQVQTFADGTKVTIFSMGKMSDETKKMVAELNKFGVSLEMIRKGDTDAIMRKIAETIDAMPAGMAKAAAGIRFFGGQWKNAVAALVAGKKAVTDLDDALDQQRIASRQMSAEQVEANKKAADQWDDLGKAIRAIKDQIGSLFAGSSFARAKWLTDMVDDARVLLQTWMKLDEAASDFAPSRADFLKGVSGSAGATAFKILVALSEQLGGIWRDVLVPAGEKLMGTIDGIAGLFEGITGSQVAAFFITAAIAAAGLALALKGIALLLTPLSLLISTVFGPFGPVLLAVAGAAALFWDELKAGAQQAAALIPQELAGIGDAFKKLFAGDFSGFWAQFSDNAVKAFEKIKAAAAQTELGKELIGQFNQIKDELKGTITLIAEAFLSLLPIATMVAEGINKVFGTNLTGTSVLAIAVIGQMTGAFQLLGIAVGIVGTAFGILVGIVGGPWAAAMVAAGVIIFEVIRKWDELKAHAIDCWTNIINWIDNTITKIGELGATLGGAIWDTFAKAGQAAIDLVMGAIDALIQKFKDAWQWASKLFSAGGGGTPEGAAPGMARGGMIGGRGSGTSDSNLAWVSRGEHIMPARAVSQPGVLAFLEALRRSGGDLRRVLDGMGHFASGGLVSMPAFASGGLGGSHNVTIQFPGLPAIGGLRASSEVVDELRKAAVMAQVRSGGRKPSRYT